MKPWPHGPYHNRLEEGLIMLTAGTYRREPFFATPEHRSIVAEVIITVYEDAGCEVHAYVVLPNHYHLLFTRPPDSPEIDKIVGRTHRSASTLLNRTDNAAGRRVFHQYWESKVKSEAAYLARINYIHQNPVKHGFAKLPDHWDTSSYAWFVSTAPTSFVETVATFKTDLVAVPDNY